MERFGATVRLDEGGKARPHPNSIRKLVNELEAVGALRVFPARRPLADMRAPR